MKKYLSCLLVLLVSISFFGHSQGWVGKGYGILYTVTEDRDLNDMYVGIGTDAPTAQLHTTGSVRFEGITNVNESKVLVIDSDGNVFWRDASTIGNPNAWLLGGNNITGSSQYIGTNNDYDFIIRRNNSERIWVQDNRFVSFRKLHIGLPSSLLGGSPSTQLNSFSGSYLGSQGILEIEHGDLFLRAFNGVSIDKYGGMDGSSATYANGLQSPPAGTTGYTGSGSFSLRTRINSTTFRTDFFNDFFGRTGIGTGSAAPTTKLHVDCTIPSEYSATSGERFENLQSGEGYILVIDEDGYVLKSSMTEFRLNQTNSDSKKILELQNKIDDLQKQIEELKKICATSIPVTLK